jgi:hypothetical protein
VTPLGQSIKHPGFALQQVKARGAKDERKTEGENISGFSSCSSDIHLNLLKVGDKLRSTEHSSMTA